jgi:hypothetical protein
MIINSNTKIVIICPKHGEFLQTPNSHLNGNGCPACVNIISKGETEFLNYINIKKENRQKYIKPYKVDGLDNNIIYEFLGNYYHGNPEFFDPNKLNIICKKLYGELYRNTFQRFDKLKQLGYNIKYIWESDWTRYQQGIDPIPNIISH